MKKSKFLIGLINLGIIVTPIALLSSCNKQGGSHFDDIPTEKKEKTSEEGSFTCTYSFDLHNELQSGQSIKITLTKTSGSEGADVELSKEPEVKGKTLSFETTLKLNSNDATFYCIFDVNVTCVDSSSKSVWEEKLTNFKHTVKSEKHDVTATSKVSNVEASVDTTFITESTPVVLTINNTRTTTVNDANLTIKVNEQHVNIAIPLENGIIPVGSSTITYTKETIQALFPSYVITGTDSISFYIVRSGKYEVKEHRLYKFDDFGDSAEITTDADWQLVENKFLLKDNTSGDFFLKENFGNFIKTAPALAAGEKYTIYLLNGTYFSDVEHGIYNFNRESVATFDVSGVLTGTSTITKKATVRSYLTVDEGLQYDYGVGAGNVIFNFSYINILGNLGERDTAHENNTSRGFMASGLNFDHCDFQGAYTLWYTKTKFEHCTFDTTKAWSNDSDKLRNVAAVWVYSDAQAYFDDCDFHSGGKSIKFQPVDGTKHVVKNCRFTLDTSYIEATVTPQRLVSVDPVINLGCDWNGGGQIHVYYKDITITDYPQGADYHYEINGEFASHGIVHPDELPADPW